MATQTSQQETALLSTGAVVAAAGNTYEHPGSNCRTRDLSQPLPAQTATNSQALMTAAPAVSVLTAEWHAMLADLRLEDCYLRMLGAHEIGRGCGFDVNFPDHEGTFICWGSERDQTDGFGNAVSPPVGWWIGDRLRAVLHREQVAS